MGTGVGQPPGRPLSPISPNLWKTPPSPFVISIGNIAFGGRGKTPVTALIARMLVEAGERPAILSRGYGRRINAPGVVVVSDGTHILADLDRAGDEPLMLARDVPGAAVLVCPERAIAGALATKVLGATVLVLDDGFQHQMRRDVDVVLVAPEDLRGRRAPFGQLRASAASLDAADALIVDGDLDAVARQARVARLPRFQLRRQIAGIAVYGHSGDVTSGTGAAYLAVAGIARPERFQAALVAAGVPVARLLAFRDHHRYTARDLRAIADAVRAAGAAGVVTTAKDAVRLAPLRPWPFALAVARLDVAVEPGDAFRQFVIDRLTAVRSR